MAGIKTMTIRHEAILDYLLANPDKKLRDVAKQFGVSQPWLSSIIHSDAFQSKLEIRKDELFGETVLPLRERLLGLAHLGVDKLGESLEHASPINEKEYIRDTTDTILKNIGYSPKSGPPGTQVAQQNNFYVVNKDDLESARARMRQAHPAIEDKGVTIDAEEDNPAKGV